MPHLEKHCLSSHCAPLWAGWAPSHPSEFCSTRISLLFMTHMLPGKERDSHCLSPSLGSLSNLALEAPRTGTRVYSFRTQVLTQGWAHSRCLGEAGTLAVLNKLDSTSFSQSVGEAGRGPVRWVGEAMNLMWNHKKLSHLLFSPPENTKKKVSVQCQDILKHLSDTQWSFLLMKRKQSSRLESSRANLIEPEFTNTNLPSL